MHDVTCSLCGKGDFKAAVWIQERKSRCPLPLLQAFEPELDWSHFGVRVAQHDIPTLGDLLDNMPKGRIKELQVGRSHVSQCR